MRLRPYSYNRGLSARTARQSLVIEFEITSMNSSQLVLLRGYGEHGREHHGEHGDTTLLCAVSIS